MIFWMLMSMLGGRAREMSLRALKAVLNRGSQSEDSIEKFIQKSTGLRSM